MTGSGVTTSLTGMPDVAIVTMTEMVNQVRNIISVIDVPLICDANSGYGNPIEGKQVIAAEEMIKKIEAALYAREDDDFLLIARTDARSEKGLDEALN